MRFLEECRRWQDSRQEFVSNVSHELKTPMTSMKVLADSLIQQGDQVPAELYREFMQDIVAEIDRENVIIFRSVISGETRQESSAASDHNSKYQGIVGDYHEAFKTIGSAA